VIYTKKKLLLVVVASNGKAMVPNITAEKLFGPQINAQRNMTPIMLA
jgi:hypothetical protein